jgi:general stress protein 26
MSEQESGVDRVWALIDAIKVAMVVTHDGHGQELRARPMAAHPAREENAIYFLTDAGSGKVGELKENSSVCLAFGDTKAQDYVSVTGEARLSNDRTLIKKFWSLTDRVFWKDENDPAIRLLRIEPREAEYWQGSAALVTYVKMVVAGLTTGKPNLHGNAKVSLSGQHEG